MNTPSWSEAVQGCVSKLTDRFFEQRHHVYVAPIYVATTPVQHQYVSSMGLPPRLDAFLENGFICIVALLLLMMTTDLFVFHRQGSSDRGPCRVAFVT